MKKYLLTLIGLFFFTIHLFSQTSYYSQGTGDFTTLTNWDTNIGGGGSDPTVADLTGGNIFIIQNTHTITVDDSINVHALTVTGTLTIGNSTTIRNIIINSFLTVDVGGVLNVGSFEATHTIYLKGTLTNNGSINLRNSSAQVANVVLDGAFSITGSNTPTFNGLMFNSGTVTANIALDVDGPLTIKLGATFIPGTYTHTVAGNWTEDGTFISTDDGTIEMNAPLVQSITENAVFNNLIFNGGGVASIADNISVNKNLLITNNTSVVTSANNTFNGNFTVADGSSYKANDGYAYFYGASDQSINIGDNVEFDRVNFQTGVKTIYGNLTANDYCVISSNATVADDGNTHNQTFANGFSLEGTCSFSGTVTLKGGTVRDYGDSDFTIGTAKVVVEGNVFLYQGHTMRVEDDFSINSGYFVIQKVDAGNDSKLIGSAGHAFLVKDNTSLYLRGTDNFPTGFDTYTFEEESWARYDVNIPQTIRGGITYGYLYFYRNIKTVDGALDINNNLYVYASNTDSVYLALQAYNHTLAGNLYDNYDVDHPERTSWITASGGNFTFDASDDDQYLYARTAGTYTFNNLFFINNAPTVERTKYLDGNIEVNGDFSVTNSSENPSMILIFDINENKIDNSGGSATFTIGSNVELRTSGDNNFLNTTNSFNSFNLDLKSTVRFDGRIEDGVGSQNIPCTLGLEYGNIKLYGNGNKIVFGTLIIKGDICREGYTPVFKILGSSSSVEIAGDWDLGIAYTDIPNSATVTFNGTNQIISASNFGNIIFAGTAAGIKSIHGNLYISSNVTINNGVIVNADNRYIEVVGNWDNGSTGTFTQSSGRVTFNGSGHQTIFVQSDNNSAFNQLYIDKSADTLQALSDFVVNQHFRFTENKGDFDLGSNTLSIGGDWYIYNGCEFLHNADAKIIFNGNTEEQLIRNYNANTDYCTLEFIGSGVKRLYEQPFDINGDFIMNNATVAAEWFEISVSGDWTNTGGSFSHYRAVVFDGADQTIDGSTFHDVTISGTETKKLNGNLSLNGWLKIDTIATLDASPDGGTTSYNISVEEQWYNNEWNYDSTKTGAFIPRKGCVTFVGGYSNIYTGDSIDADGNGRTGKQFYDLEINNSDINISTILYPIRDINNIKTDGNDLRVLHDFIIDNGIFYTYWNDVYVGGDFRNTGGNFNQNTYYTKNSKLTLEGASGSETFDFDAGDYYTIRQTNINGGGEYQLVNNLTLSGNNDLTKFVVDSGTFNLNHHELNMDSNTGDVTINSNGTLFIDSSAVLRIYNGRTLTNNGGNLKIIGTEDYPATVSSMSGNYNFVQNSGTLFAKNCLITSTQGNGVDIQGGSIDGTYNFSETTFSDGIGTAYLTMSGINFSDNTVTNVVFNNGTTYNVQKTSGTGTIIFENSSGTLSGENYDNDDSDPGTLIAWTYPGAKFWVGTSGGGDGSSWEDANNWSGSTVPNDTANVHLDHTTVAGSYRVDIDAQNAITRRLTIDGGGAIPISLVLNGKELTVGNNITIGVGDTLTQTLSTDTIRVAGGWANQGTFNEGTATVIFNPGTGSYAISTNGLADPFYDLIIDANNGIVGISTNIIAITDSISINSGIFAATNKDIHINGDWALNGGIFDGGTATVIFEKTGSTVQKIQGGTFYNFKTRNSATKELSQNISVTHDLEIELGSVLDGKTYFIFMGHDWDNYEGASGFTQTGAGTVVFNGTGTSRIGDVGLPTTFNNLIAQGAGTKYIYNDLTINGDLTNQLGSNLYIEPTASINGSGADNTLIMTGGILYLRGTNNFPTGFENISLTGGYVDYYSDDDQAIYPTTYYNLRLRRVHEDSLNTKTLTDDIYVKGSLSVYDDDTELSVDNHQIILTGNLSMATDGLKINWGTGILIHDGENWNIDVDLKGFNNVIKKGSAWVTMYNNLDITGNVTFYDETNLNMQQFALDCSVSGKEFKIGADSRIYSYLADTATASGGKAFPTGFDIYDIDATNTTYIRGNENQTILSTPVYGNLYLYDNSSRTVKLDGDLTVLGDFRMYYDYITLEDSSHNISIGGSTVDLRDYIPKNTITFNGASGQNIYAGGSYTTLKLNNVVFNGIGGQKTLNETTIYIEGNLTIIANDTLNCSHDLYFSGDTLANDGFFNHTNNIVYFDDSTQVIDPGTYNNFYGVVFSNRGTKKIVNHGLNVNNGIFSIEQGADSADSHYRVIVDMGNVSHNIASLYITNLGEWITNDANITFDRNGNQYIPEMTLNNIRFSASGWKIMEGELNVQDFTIDDRVYFRTSDLGDNPYNINLTGNWSNRGYFQPYEDTVFFESDLDVNKTIQSGGYSFYDVMFNQSQTSARTYTLIDNATITNKLTVGNNATLKLNGKNLTLGNNDDNESTFPYYPNGEHHYIQAGGTLDVDAGSNLQFDMYDLYPTLTVNGTLKVVGENGNNANVTRSQGYNNRGVKIDIESGATIKAKYYQFQYLSYDGLDVKDGAIVDDTNNFSDGVWSNIYSGTQYSDPAYPNNDTIRNNFVYLNINADVTGLPVINNVTFNHGTSPAQSTHFNVRRSASATDTLKFGGIIGGLLGGEIYESDPDALVTPGKITWPPISLVTWTGNVSTDWFTAGNWSPANIPTSIVDAVIPITVNNPSIYKTGAICNNLNITDGILGIETGVDTIKVNKDVLLGADAILAVEDTAVINVKGDYNIASDAVFLNGQSTVLFSAPNGSVLVEPRNAAFHNIEFNGGATFYLSGDIDIDGNLIIYAGDVIPNTNNYNYTITGNYNNSGGTFHASQNDGWLVLSGVNQSITNGTFNRLDIAGTGTKTMYGSLSIDYLNTYVNYNALEVEENSTIKADAACAFTIMGNVEIKQNGTFDDGGQTHNFKGRYWKGTGNYSGTGTINFNGGTQYLYAAKFNNLILSNTDVSTNNYKYLSGNVDVSGNVTVDCYYFDIDTLLINNTAGSGTFALENAAPGGTRIYVSGADNYPNNFSNYTADTESYTFYDGANDQTIRSGVQFGNLYLDGANRKTLEGNIDINNRLYFYDSNDTLDAAGNIIYIAGYWYNQYSGTFLPNSGEVIFDGDDEQRIYLGTSGSNDFYRLRIYKPENVYCRLYYSNVTVENKLSSRGGIFYLYNNYTVTVNGDLIADNTGKFYQTGTYYLSKTGGDAQIQTNGSTLNNLTINSNATYTLIDDLTLDGTFTITSGIFDGNGKIVTLGNSYDVANMAGIYKVGAGGSLKLGNRCSFNVKDGGTFYAVGTVENYAQVTNRNSYRYYFTVEDGGTIHANNYLFEYMEQPGVQINNGAIIDATDNFSNGTFTNPYSGGTCLQIENTQRFGASDSIYNVSFPVNPGYGTYNLSKTTSTAGDLYFYDAKGPLSGENYDNDSYNLIHWTGAVTLTWTGDVDQDWFKVGNWHADVGSDKVPTTDEDVVIPQTTIFPQISQSGAEAASLIIDNSAFLTLNINAATGVGLEVAGDININGNLIMTTDNDTLSVAGSWIVDNNGIFTAGSGTVIFNGTGVKIVDNYNSPFNNLIIEVSGTIQTARDLTVNGNFIISSGGFDVTSSNRDLTVKGDFINNDIFIAQSGKLTLNSSGENSFNPGSSVYYDVDIISGTYNLTGSELNISRNFDLTSGTFNLNSNTFNFGDGAGSDDLSIYGILYVNDDANLKMADNASLDVYSGGEFKAIGSLNHPATITHQNSGRYSFSVSDGGEIYAKRYVFEYMDTTGIFLKSGSTVNESDSTFSNGVFANGASGGRYLLLENDFTADTFKVYNAYFNNGATYNVKRNEALTTGIFDLKDALGLVASYYFEDDDGSSTSGAVTWSYTDPTLWWTGADTLNNNTRWDNHLNWDNLAGGDGVPSITTNVFIPDVSEGYNQFPVLNAGTDTLAQNITIFEGASLTLGGDMDLTIDGDMTIGGSFIISNGSSSTINVDGQWANSGTFTHGGNSTVILTATDNWDIDAGNNFFYNLEINSGSGTAIFTTQSNIYVDNDFAISKGILTVKDATHNIFVGGDWSNFDTFNCGNATVTFDGTAQSITNASGETFNNLVVAGTGIKTLNNNITVNNDLTINSTFSAGSNTIDITGNWYGTGAFTPGTSTVSFTGSSSQGIEKSETFYNLVINNSSSSTAILLDGEVVVNNQLTLSDGLVETSPSHILTIADGATVLPSPATSASYIDGPMKKIGAQDFVFPIGTSSVFARLGISTLTSSSTFTAEYHDVAYSNTISLEAGLNSVSDVEYWNLSRFVGTATPKVTYYWEDGTRSGIPDIDALVAANFSSSEWKNKGQSSFIGDLNKGSVTSNDAYSTFGPGTFGFSYITLTWDGSESTDWNDANNWSDPPNLPSKTTNLIIPDVTNDPIVSTAGREVFNLIILNGGKVTISNSNDLTIYGSLDNQIGGTLDMQSNAILNVKEDWTNVGTFTAGTGTTVNFNGTKDQSINNDGPFNNLLIGGTGTMSLNNSITVNGNISISGTLDALTSTINLKGNWTNTGTFNRFASTVNIFGNTQQTITNTSVENFYNLTINNTNTTAPQVVLGRNVLVYNEFTLTSGVVQTTSSNLLSLDYLATANEGSDKSYVIGPLRKYGTADFVFPIGKDSVYARLGISSMTGSGNFIAEYFNAPYSDITTMGTNMDHVSKIEYWDLSSPGSGTAEPYVKLFWEDSSRSVIDAPDSLVVSHYENDKWNDFGNSAFNEAADSSGWIISNLPFTRFSPITFGVTTDKASSNPLPIELLSFTANLDNDKVNISWITASEKNNDYFTVQRSSDAYNFEDVEDVSGAGNSSDLINYSATDYDPLFGMSYYRLKQTNYNGKSTYSDLLDINYQFNDFNKQLELGVYPNPLRSEAELNIMLSNVPDGDIVLRISDLLGNTYLSKKVTIFEYQSKKLIKIKNNMNLKAGIYLISITGKECYSRVKLMIE
ncbi:MAG: hypothetical protein IMY72_08350 [Bacteroidetes bacterium]|nr:hypothetical protein [Bacteroidota bacterium]